MRKETISNEFKAMVVLEALKETKTLEDLSKEFGVKPELIASWKFEFSKKASSVFSNQYKWMNFIPLIISTCSIIISIYIFRVTSAENHTHNIKAVRPILNGWVDYTESITKKGYYGYSITNVGLGPATIKCLRMSYNNKIIHNWDTLNYQIADMNKNKIREELVQMPARYSKFDSITISPSQSIELYSINKNAFKDTSNSKELIKSILDSLSFTIKYYDIFGDCDSMTICSPKS
ncbi:MAG: transposase [Bacteroidia bacterium]